jgi:hypothetical protein
MSSSSSVAAGGGSGLSSPVILSDVRLRPLRVHLKGLALSKAQRGSFLMHLQFD